MDQVLQAFTNLRLQFGLNEEQEEATAASTENLTSGCSRTHGFFVDGVDFRCRNFVGKAAFAKPALMQQFAKFIDLDICVLEYLYGLINHLPHALQFDFTALEIFYLRFCDF